MSLTRGLIIKSGRPTLPQFRDRPVSTTGLLNPPLVDAPYYALPVTGDVRGLYFTYLQFSGVAAAEQIRFSVVVDGTAYTGVNLAAAHNTLYYVYLNDNADALVDSVNRTGMKIGFPWYGQSMFCLLVEEIMVPVGSTLQGWVRYEQL